MFTRFYAEVGDVSLCQKFVEVARELNQPLSPAQIQGHFLLYKQNPQLAIDNIAEMVGPLKKKL